MATLIQIFYWSATDQGWKLERKQPNILYFTIIKYESYAQETRPEGRGLTRQRVYYGYILQPRIGLRYIKSKGTFDDTNQ